MLTTTQVDILLVTWFQYGQNRKQDQAEVMPSSSLVEIEVGFVFHNLDVPSIQLRCSLDFFHYLHGWVGGWAGWWVVGKLESNAKLNSKLRLKLKLEMSLAKL